MPSWVSSMPSRTCAPRMPWTRATHMVGALPALRLRCRSEDDPKGFRNDRYRAGNTFGVVKSQLQALESGPDGKPAYGHCPSHNETNYVLPNDPLGNYLRQAGNRKSRRFGHHESGETLVGPTSHHDRPHGAGENVEIEPGRQVAAIVRVERFLLPDVPITARGYLPHSGEAGEHSDSQLAELR